jgi:hypothetical protein
MGTTCACPTRRQYPREETIKAVIRIEMLYPELEAVEKVALPRSDASLE